MNRSLYIAATGMNAQQAQMDVISNNLANTSTNGFKASRAVFEDLLPDHSPAGRELDAADGTAVGPAARHRRAAGRDRAPVHAGRPHADRQREGRRDQRRGLQVLMPDGTNAYARRRVPDQRAGPARHVERPGILPAITIPQNATSLTIGKDGVVTVTQAPTNSGADRLAAGRDLHQPGRPRGARREPVLRDDVVGRAERVATGAERRGHAQPELRRSVERERRAGAVNMIQSCRRSRSRRTRRR